MTEAVSKKDIRQCLMRDQHRLGRKLADIRGGDKRGRDVSKPMQALQRQVQQSREAVEQRRRRLPTVSFPEQLPVSARREEIAHALEQHQVVVVAGETGSGKTTQIPKLCLDMGYGARGLIGHTQPRRLAARSVAGRIAEELDEPLGRGIGYQVRFSDETSPGTWVKLMTDGILLAEIQQDRFLNQYEVLIIDEAHERSLNIDFLLGYLKRLLPRRPELKLIITSATIDVDKFSAHFDGAPIVSVSGRTYPVDIIYRDEEEIAGEAEAQGEDWLIHGVRSALQTIEDMDRERGRGPGDVLVFLSGEREIRDLAAALRRSPDPRTEILPLYARLSASEQRRIFAPHRGRRIILSTNVAETSLTVPGIVYVIDSGMARISRYSVQSKVQRLPVERISRASADQRAGRCGRVTSGTCIRLYSEQDFLERPEFTDPEIQRTNLSSVILQMLMLGLGDIEQFPFVEPPEQRAINDGFRLLQELGAIDGQRRISPVGRKMARMPADPRLARMLIEADARGCLQDMLIIVSALSIQDPREAPADKRQAARERHRRYAHPRSDFLSFVRLWEDYETQRQQLSQNQLRRYCRDNFLSFMRMREWRETHRQLMLACQRMGMKKTRRREDEDIDYEAVHRAILRGSLNQIGARGQDRRYTGSRGRVFSLFPSSGLASSPPRWVVTAELVETSRLFATLAAEIEPEWAVDAAGDLARREYFEPHWEKKKGQVVAFEKITLFGLTLIEKRRVAYAGIDPKISREIFIREALVDMQLETRCPFFRHNRELVAGIRREEEKLRRPDILADEQTLVDFYEARLPEGICDARRLEQWWRDNPEEEKCLHMRREDLMQRELDEQSQRDFPDHAHIQHNRLPIHYRFRPGSSDDGASIEVPAAMLNSVTETDLDWAVPGQVPERCQALLRGLPKSLRKKFIPIPDFVQEALAEVEPGQQPLRRMLREQARRLRRVEIDPASLEEAELPPHLRPRIRVTDEQGRELDSDHSLGALRGRLQIPEEATRPRERHPLERDGLRDWDCGELPSELTIREGITLLRYPALADRGDSASVVLLESPGEAARSHREGLTRLVICRTPQQKQMIWQSLKQLRKELGLRFPGHLEDFENHALTAIYRHAFSLDHQQVRDVGAFGHMLEEGRKHLMEDAERIVRMLRRAFEALFDIHRELAALEDKALQASVEDIRQQLEWLVGSDFPAHVPADRVEDYPRYFRALNRRLEKLQQQPERDRESMEIIRRLRERYLQLMEQHGDEPMSGLADFPWLLQELRISFFAQPLKTRVPVSEKRLQRKLQAL